MKLKIMIVVCCTLMLCTLTGCQLANKNEEANSNADRLVGVLITKEYLAFQSPLYAHFVPDTFDNEEANATGKFVFEGIDGIEFFIVTVPAANEEYNISTSMAHPAISNPLFSFSETDEGKNSSIDGTIFVAPSSKINHLYFNPIYQSADGKSVYAIAGDSYVIEPESNVLDFIFSQTMNETKTITENGKTKTEGMTVKISISLKLAPEKIVILQMGFDDAIVSKTEHEPVQMPDDFILEMNTTYFIVETHSRDNLGNLIISREIYGSDVDCIVTYFARADGICTSHQTQITVK